MRSTSNEALTETSGSENELPFSADETEYIEADDTHKVKRASRFL